WKHSAGLAWSRFPASNPFCATSAQRDSSTTSRRTSPPPPPPSTMPPATWAGPSTAILKVRPHEAQRSGGGGRGFWHPQRARGPGLGRRHLGGRGRGRRGG